MSKFDSKALEGIFVGYAAESHAFRIFDKESARVVEVSNVRFDENDGFRVEQSGVCDVGDEIPPQAIRRMGVGHLIPIEGHLLVEGEGLCSTQVEPSSSQAQQASPKEATNAPTEEQDKDLHEEEGAPPSSPVISTAPNSSQD